MSGSKRKKETLEFIHSMLSELRSMSRTEGCDMLTYLVEQAYIEAEDMLRGQRPLNTRTGAKLFCTTDLDHQAPSAVLADKRPAA